MPVKRSKVGRMKRVMKAKEPKMVEDPKKILFLRGHRTNEELLHIMRDLSRIVAPRAVRLQKRNLILPFEDTSSLEFLCERNDCACFVLANHTKKRPDNLIFGRIFDGAVFDMMEFGVRAYGRLEDFADGDADVHVGIKPCFLFQGPSWETEPTLSRARSLLLDTFRGRQIESLALPALQWVIVVSESPQPPSSTPSGSSSASATPFLPPTPHLLHLRGYRIQLKRSGGREPRVELKAMGPFADLEVRRVAEPSVEASRMAFKVPRGLKEKKQKNVSRDALGEKIGRIHMERQEFENLYLRKMKALRKPDRGRRAGKKDGEGEGDGDGEGEGEGYESEDGSGGGGESGSGEGEEEEEEEEEEEMRMGVDEFGGDVLVGRKRTKRGEKKSTTTKRRKK